MRYEITIRSWDESSGNATTVRDSDDFSSALAWALEGHKGFLPAMDESLAKAILFGEGLLSDGSPWAIAVTELSGQYLEAIRKSRGQST